MHPTEVLGEVLLPRETRSGTAFTVLEMAEDCLALRPVNFALVA
jgi:hypothetical protein